MRQGVLRAAFAALVAFGWVAGAHAGSNAKAPLTLDTAWKLSLDATGRIVALEAEGPLKPVLHDSLARTIRGWSFEPGRVEGRPAPTETTLSLVVAVEPRGGDDYGFRVVSTHTGGGVDKIDPPWFPKGELKRSGPSFAVLAIVEVRYNEAGKVVSTRLAPGAPPVRRAFEEAAVAAVRRWTFRPERVAGRAVAATVDVPICFVSQYSREDPAPACGQWASPDAGARSGADASEGPASAMTQMVTVTATRP